MRRGLFLSFLLMVWATAAGAEPTGPQPTLPIQTVVIDSDHGPVTFRMEIASDHDSQEAGLMFRKTMAPNAGMLFDFHQPVFTTFWMKNTILPLDMLFVREDGTISSIAPNAVPYSETPIPSGEPVRAVIEINGGRAAQLGIEPGGKVHASMFGTVARAR